MSYESGYLGNGPSQCQRRHLDLGIPPVGIGLSQGLGRHLDPEGVCLRYKRLRYERLS